MMLQRYLGNSLARQTSVVSYMAPWGSAAKASSFRPSLRASPLALLPCAYSARSLSSSARLSIALRGESLLPATHARNQRPLPHRAHPAPDGSGGSRWSRGSTGKGGLTPFIRRFNRIPNNYILWSLVGLNLSVLVAWKYAEERMRRYHDPRLYLFMSGNFLSGESNVRQGRWWTILTSCVSQSDLGHFTLNMVSLYFMAPHVLAFVGPASLISLYFGAGAISSILSMSWTRWVNPWIAQRSAGRQNGLPAQVAREAEGRRFSHGASGSVYAIMTTFACMQPRATFLLFFVVPAPAWLLVPGIFAWDFYSAWFTPYGGTDSSGHIGGILAGLLFWRFRLRGVSF